MSKMLDGCWLVVGWLVGWFVCWLVDDDNNVVDDDDDVSINVSIKV